MTDQLEQPQPIEAKKEEALRNLFRNVSQPKTTLRSELGNRYSTMVSDTDEPYVKKVKRYNDDPTPEEVWLDNNGRYLRITSYGKEETFAYDEDGYLTNSSLTENAGQGWDRKFSYTSEGGEKRLSKLEVTRYSGAGSTKEGMKRGEQTGEIQIVNFDANGKPDNLIPLWVYSD